MGRARRQSALNCWTDIDQQNDLVFVTVRNMEGVILFGPQQLPRIDVPQHLQSVLLSDRKKQSVRLISSQGQFLDKDAFASVTSVECTAFFTHLELSPEERAYCLEQVQNSAPRHLSDTIKDNGLVEKLLNFPEAARIDHE